MINTFLKIYFTIGLVIFILTIVSICIINVLVSYTDQHTDKNNDFLRPFKNNDFLRSFKIKTIKEAFSGLIDCILFSFILWPVAVISNIVVFYKLL